MPFLEEAVKEDLGRVDIWPPGLEIMGAKLAPEKFQYLAIEGDGLLHIDHMAAARDDLQGGTAGVMPGKFPDGGEEHVVLAAHDVESGMGSHSLPVLVEERLELGSQAKPADEFLLIEFAGFANEEEARLSVVATGEDNAGKYFIKENVRDYPAEDDSGPHEETRPEIELENGAAQYQTIYPLRVALGNFPDDDGAQRYAYEMTAGDVEVI